MQKNNLTSELTNSKSTNFTPWLNSDQVCTLLGISSRTLFSYRKLGILPFSQISRKIYYRPDDITEYLQRHYIKADYQKDLQHD